MSYGLEVYDASGNPVLSVADRVGRIFGSVTVSTTAGSLTNAAFADGTPFYQLQVIGGGFGSFTPVVSFSGNTMSWDYNSSDDKISGIIFYGVY